VLAGAAGAAEAEPWQARAVASGVTSVVCAAPAPDRHLRWCAAGGEAILAPL
jgi:hypothetical protein